MDVSFDGKFLLTGSRDKKLKVWSLQSLAHFGDLSGHEGAIYVARA